MGLTFRIEELNTLGQLLGFLPQVMYRYRWGPQDVDLLHLAPDDKACGAQTPAGFYLRVGRRLSSAEAAYVTKVVQAQFPCEKVPNLPSHRAIRPLPDFLEESFPLVPVTVDGWKRQDVLVAVYEQSSLSRVYGSALKNPHHHQPPEIWFLEGPPEEKEDWPECLFIVPQATVDGRWQRWLEAVNEPRGDGSDLVKLYCGLPARSAVADYYVEYGWRHPVAHLPELHAAHDMRWVLISAALSAEGGKTPDARWSKVKLGPESTGFHGSADAVFDIQLPRPLRPVTLSAVRPPEKIRLRARLRHVAAKTHSDLEKLQQQIQTTKEKLFRMERERMLLLGRKRSRFRFVLRFKEHEGGDGKRSLCPHFKRFLMLSEPHLKRFRYAYQDDEFGAFHVVLATEACYHEDLHLWLADEVYYQMDYWQSWGFNVFVADQFELMPAVDDLRVKEAVAQALAPSLPSSEDASRERCLLLRPLGQESSYDEPGLPFTVIAVDVPRDPDHTLIGDFEFLQAAFSEPEREAHQVLASQLKAELDAHAAELFAKLEEIEQHLGQETENRLAILRKTWNQLSARIEHDYDLVQHLQGFYQMVQQMVRDFSHQWGDFATQFFEVTDRLVSDKIHALENLTSGHDKWRGVLDDAVASLCDVRSKLDQLRTEMVDRVKRAETVRDRTRAEFETTEKKHKDLKAQADVVTAEVAGMLDAADRDDKQLQEERDKVRAAFQSTQVLKRQIQEGAQWLQRHRKCFGEVVEAARRNVGRCKDALDALQSLRSELRGLDGAWKSVFRDAAETAQGAQTLQQQASQELPQLSQQCGSLIGKATLLVQRVERELAEMDGDQRRARKQVADLLAKCEKMTQASAAAEAAKKQLEQAQKQEEQLSARLEESEECFWFHGRRLERELAGRVKRLMADVEALSEMETEFRTATVLRQAAAFQAECAKEYAKCRALPDQQYQSLWKK